jgi:hypothetical protein
MGQNCYPQEEMEKSSILLSLQHPCFVIDKCDRQKIHTELVELYGIINHLGEVDIYRALHPRTEYTLCLSSQGIKDRPMLA